MDIGICNKSRYDRVVCLSTESMKKLLSKQDKMRIPAHYFGGYVTTRLWDDPESKEAIDEIKKTVGDGEICNFVSIDTSTTPEYFIEVDCIYSILKTIESLSGMLGTEPSDLLHYVSKDMYNLLDYDGLDEGEMDIIFNYCFEEDIQYAIQAS